MIKINAKRFVSGVTGVDFNTYLDRRLIPDHYQLNSDSTSLLFARVISKSEGSIFTLLELRRFNNTSKFNLTFSLKNIKGPDHLPVASFVRVINEVSSAYGKDDSGMGKIENDELDDLEKNTWIGRAWLESDKFQIPILIGQDEGNYFSITFFLDNSEFENVPT